MLFTSRFLRETYRSLVREIPMTESVCRQHIQPRFGLALIQPGFVSLKQEEVMDPDPHRRSNAPHPPYGPIDATTHRAPASRFSLIWSAWEPPRLPRPRRVLMLFRYFPLRRRFHCAPCARLSLPPSRCATRLLASTATRVLPYTDLSDASSPTRCPCFPASDRAGVLNRLSLAAHQSCFCAKTE